MACKVAESAFGIREQAYAIERNEHNKKEHIAIKQYPRKQVEIQ